MSKQIRFDFCIIPNPFSNGSRNMIFIAKTGDNFIDKNLVNSKDYQDIKEIIEKFGYTETGYLQFESSNNPQAPSTPVEIKKFLENCGLNYSRELEVSIIRDLNILKRESDRSAQNTLDFIYGDYENPDFSLDDNDTGEDVVLGESTKNKLIEAKSELFMFKHKEPELREKITLYFYLFLEFGFNQFGKPIIQFGGDFKDSDNHDDRNYIKIVSSEFERVGDPKKPNSIILSSCKNQGDFLKEVGILYSGFFRYQRSIEKMDSIIVEEKKYPYKIAEVKKFLDPSQSIVVETNRMGYDRLIGLSNRIRSESVVESGKLIPTMDIEYKAEELSKFLTKRMSTLSDNEDFEEAAKMKKDVDFIKNQVEYVKGLNKTQITTEEYFKIFSVS